MHWSVWRSPTQLRSHTLQPTEHGCRLQLAHVGRLGGSRGQVPGDPKGGGARTSRVPWEPAAGRLIRSDFFSAHLQLLQNLFNNGAR